MEKKYLTYREVLYVIEYCMTDGSANQFFDSITGYDGKDGESRFNYNKISDLKRFHTTLNDDEIDILETSVDYDTLKEHIIPERYDDALALLNSSIDEAGLWKNIKSKRDDLPSLIIESLKIANTFFINHRKEVKAAYKGKTYIKPKPHNEPDVLDILSKAFADEATKKRARYKLTEINLSLLSKGILSVRGKTQNETKDLMDFLKEDKDLLITGDGGIGKTTFLFHALDTYMDDDLYIPFYFSLTKLKAKGREHEDIDSHFIKDAFDKMAEKENIKDFDLYKSISKINDGRKVLLLLDGINEISIDHNSHYRTLLMKEIESFAILENVRIVATSRPFNSSKTYLADALHIEATGIEPGTVKECLRESNLSDSVSDSLMEILKIPLFLLMYISNGKRGIKAQDSKGAILYEYFNSDNQEHYTEAFIQKELTALDRDMPDYIAPLNDFLFPEIASQMHKNDSFSITSKELDNLLTDLNDLMINDLSSHDNHYHKYVDTLALPSMYARKIQRAYDTDINIQQLIIDRLSFLQPDYQDSFSFVHQHIRDYFAAIMNLNAILLPSDKLTKPYMLAFSYGWTVDVIEFMKDVYLYTRSFISVDDLMGKLSFFSLDERKSSIAISNLFRFLASIYDNDLSTLTFNNIDFSKCNFNSINFHNPITNTSAAFNNCVLSENIFRTPYNIKNYSRFFSFYEKKPVKIECHEKQNLLEIHITDLISGYLIASYTYPHKDTFLYDSSIIDASISEDLKHIAFVFADDNTMLSALVICELIVDDNFSCERKILHVEGFNDLTITPFFRADGELVIASDSLEFFMYSFDAHKLFSILKFDQSKITGYEFKPCNGYDLIFKQISDDRYLLFYPIEAREKPNNDYYIVVLDVSTGTITVCPQIMQDLYYYAVYVYEDCLYYAYKNAVHVLNLSSFEIKDITFERGKDILNSSLGVCVQNGYIYVIAPALLYIINLNNTSDITIANHSDHLPMFLQAHNDSYLLFNNPTFTDIVIYRISQGSFSSIEYPDSGNISDAFYDDIIPILYNRGQVSLISNSNFELLDSMIFSNTVYSSHAYDSKNKLLALSLSISDSINMSKLCVFKITSKLEKVFEVTTSYINSMVFDSNKRLLYIYAGYSFHVYDMNTFNESPLDIKEYPYLFVSYSDFRDGIVRFFGAANFEEKKTQLKKAVCELDYSNGIIIQKYYILPAVMTNSDMIDAIRGKYNEFYEIYIKNGATNPFKNDPYMEIYDPHDFKLIERIPINPIDTPLVNHESDVYINVPFINDPDEKNYSFTEDGDGLVIYKFGQNDDIFNILYGARFGDFTHVKGDILISAYRDNSLFKYDLNKDSSIAFTKFIPNINIVNAKFNNPDCSEKVIEILKDNGADL